MVKKFLVMLILSALLSGVMSVSAVTNTVYVHETNADFSNVFEKSDGITLSTYFYDRDPSGTGFPKCFSVAPGKQHIIYKASGPISWFFLQAAVNRTTVTDTGTNINSYIKLSFSNDNVTYRPLKAGTVGPGNDYLFLFPTTPKKGVTASTLTNTTLGSGTLIGGNFGSMRFDNHPWTAGFNAFDPNIRYIKLEFDYTPAVNPTVPVFYLMESGFQYSATTPVASVINGGSVPARKYFDVKFSQIMKDATVTPEAFTIANSSITATSVEKIDSANNIWRVRLSDNLSPDVTYTVNLANAIVSEADLSLNANSVQFTTVLSERISVDSLSFTGPSGTLTGALENGEITCSANISSLYAEGAPSQDITLITAFYEGEKLIGVGFDTQSLDVEDSGSFTTRVTVNSTTPSNVYAKVFVWEDMTDMIPLCSWTDFPE